MKILLLLIFFLGLARGAYGWDNEELEIFDIVEEVNQNFYELMGLKQVIQVDF